MQSKLSYRDFLEVMRDRLVTVHVCDYDESALKVPGKGKFDFITFFKALKDCGYDGPVLMELYSKDYDSFDEIAEGKEYLENCLERAVTL